MDALVREAARIEEDALHSAKGHFEAARRWGAVHHAFGVPVALLAAVAGASAFKDWTEAAVALSAVVAGLTAVSTFLDPSSKAATHHQAGARFNSLRSRARFFQQIDLDAQAAGESNIEKLRELANLRDSLNESSPQIPRWAFVRARKGIAAGEASYVVDAR